MSKNSDDIELLLKVLQDLNDYLPHLVLVGGWVPYVYATLLWKKRNLPIKTADIDFGVMPSSKPYTETVAQRVRKHKYGEHHESLGKINPFVPIARWNAMKSDVEFITSPKNGDIVKRNILGRELKVDEIDYFEILLEETLSVSLEGLTFQVAEPSQYVFHKLLTFVEREEITKREKDLYYIYYVLSICPQADALIRSIREMVQTHRYGSIVRKNIQAYFEDPSDRGPRMIEKLTLGTSTARTVDNVRQHAFGVIAQLI